MTAHDMGSRRIPDAARVDACRRAPDLGPKLTFFSGGSALRALSCALPGYTHNSAHLITTFDSGGSSAHLRRAFAMPSVGDIRNRLVALAEGSAGRSPTQELLSHRLPMDADRAELERALGEMVHAQHPMVMNLAEPVRGPIRGHLRAILERLPSDFDLRGASIGNLVLTAAYLAADRCIDAAIAECAGLLGVHGVVCPIAEQDAHLAARLRDGTRVVGQHLLTGKEGPPLASPIEDLQLVSGAGEPLRVAISERARQVILAADLICYPMGSFFSSVAANLLPDGVGAALRSNPCPKVYIPNTGIDPEQRGLSVEDSVEVLVELVKRDAGSNTSPGDVVDVVLLDRSPARYPQGIDRNRIRGHGIEILCLDLASAHRPDLDARILAQVLVSLT